MLVHILYMHGSPGAGAPESVLVLCTLFQFQLQTSTRVKDTGTIDNNLTAT
mgnify:CR=1 FL=1|jgi:hypothetical protein